MQHSFAQSFVPRCTHRLAHNASRCREHELFRQACQRAGVPCWHACQSSTKFTRTDRIRRRAKDNASPRVPAPSSGLSLRSVNPPARREQVCGPGGAAAPPHRRHPRSLSHGSSPVHFYDCRHFRLHTQLNQAAPSHPRIGPCTADKDSTPASSPVCSLNTSLSPPSGRSVLLKPSALLRGNGRWPCRFRERSLSLCMY